MISNLISIVDIQFSCNILLWLSCIGGFSICHYLMSSLLSSLSQQAESLLSRQHPIKWQKFWNKRKLIEFEHVPGVILCKDIRGILWNTVDFQYGHKLWPYGFTNVFAPLRKNNHKVMLQFWIFSKNFFHATFQVATVSILNQLCYKLHLLYHSSFCCIITNLVKP